MTAGTTSGTAQRGWELMARFGYVINGVLHILIGVIALQIAFGGEKKNADQSGALSTISETPFGGFILWASVVAFVALGLWQLAVAFRKQPTSQGSSTKDRLEAGLRAVIYLALAVTVFSFAQGSGTSSSKQTTDATESLMSAPGGRFLVGLLGAAIVVGGVIYALKGLRKKFLEDLHSLPSGTAGVTVRRLGIFGYTAKGVALAIVGGLFVLAAVKADPDKAKGLDGALHTLRDQPAGVWLLAIVGIGFIAYGIYSFVRSKYGKL
ncbi:DUF1206 domain-containing protein [Cellulomonas rhizosphaerae]|uniref:DUF1206 domain-containing protein n=1 Tax=Cellulomonas rhizosphaerae TaxID=2293719 RepID=A0A413RHG5_9CELL|nr:DUF1206 domain-containing protein [Cellulomonas rhizosphaerae]RHA37560.1 DUF1206 domain-containing protein [Cellulomonas rhizosphaerae]